MEIAVMPLSEAIARRNRLRNPPNAVMDHGIDLKRTAREDFVDTYVPEADLVGNPRLDKIRELEVRIARLNKELDEANNEYSQLCLNGEGRPKVRQIQDAVCQFYKVKILDLLSNRRTANIVRPRQVAVY